MHAIGEAQPTLSEAFKVTAFAQSPVDDTMLVLAVSDDQGDAVLRSGTMDAPRISTDQVRAAPSVI